MKNFKRIYMDGAANEATDMEVIKEMEPWMKHAGNSFAIHDSGIESMQAVENARFDIADVLGVRPDQILFTSGATESNNWAIQSICFKALAEKSNKKTILLSSTEHSSVVNTALRMKKIGFKVQFIPYPKNHALNGLKVASCLNEDILLACIMSVNNETGVVNDIKSIASVCNKNNIPLLCDCTQLIGGGHSIKDLKLTNEFIDFISFSSHKIYGPTGVGCLIVNNPKIIEPFIIGGAQESGLRGGTSNVAGIVGMAAAMKKFINNKLVVEYSELMLYIFSMVDKFNNIYPNCLYINGYIDQEDTFFGHLGNICSLRIGDQYLPERNLFANELINRGIEVSAGSACDSTASGVSDAKPSHVLLAMGLTSTEIARVARISLTKDLTKEDIDYLFEAIQDIIKTYKGE